MQVLKFGGTSLASAQLISNVADIIVSKNKNHKLIVVVSAIGKTTDKLIDSIKVAIKQQDISVPLENIKQAHFNIIKELKFPTSETTSKLDQKIGTYFDQYKSYLLGIKALKQCPNDIYSWISSLGERLSVCILTSYLKVQNIETSIIKSEENIIVESINSKDLMIEQTINNLSQSIIKIKNIAIMAGFVASTNEKQASTLGRNGSDFTAALVAIASKAILCEIWTDVDGVYNANPKEIPQAQLIEQLSYHEAMELSYFGASVLHPKTITPLMTNNIPCRIRNTFNPNNQGTLICHDPIKSQNFATAISSLTNVSMLTVTGPGLKGMVGMASRVFKTMALKKISIILITQSSSEYSVSFCINQNDLIIAKTVLEAEFNLEINSNLIEPIFIQEKLAVVSLISDNMKKRRGTAAQFFQALSIANVNIVAIAQGSNERSISAVIEQNRLMRGIKSCHQLFFDSRQVAEVILIGCGLVGDAFLRQIQNQEKYLDNKSIKIKVCGIINSKGALLDENGIDLVDYKNTLQTDLESIDREKLKLFRQQTNMTNPIIVDCTSSQNVAEAYIDFFKAGYHVVAANKKANTLSLSYYNELKTTATNLQRQYHYETNVGAGLPVIDTFRNLLNAGDSLIQFQGILSGSMSYIFGKLDSGMIFSEAVTKAKNKGFTEPDPRDDLSGMDIARKILIIARESGLNLDLKDVHIDSLLTNELLSCKDSNEFMKQLPLIDTQISEKVQAASDKNCVLRFVGNIENSKCSVKIEEVPKSSALYSVKDGENAIAIYSKYYHPIPMVLRGYGAGAEVTAAGIFSDVIKILPVKNSFI